MAEGLDRLIEVLRAPPSVSPTIGAQQTPRTFRMGVVTVTSPLTVTLNNDPLAAVELPYLDSVSGGGGGGGPGSGAGLVIDRGVTSTAVASSTGVVVDNGREFIPAAGAVLVALVTNRSAAGDVDVDVSDTLGDTGGTAWTMQVSDATGVSFDPTSTSIWTRTVGTGATQGKISVASFDPLFNFFDAHRALVAAFLEIPDATSAAPVQTANNGGVTDGSTNALTVTFPAVPFSASVVAAMVMDETGWIQPLAPAMTRIETGDLNYDAVNGRFDPFGAGGDKDVTWQAYNVGGAGQSMLFIGSLFTTALQGCAIEVAMGAAAPGGSPLTVGDLVLVGVFEGGAMVVLGRVHL